MKANELHDNRFSDFLYDHPKYSRVLNIYSDQQTMKMMGNKSKKLAKAGQKAEKSGNEVFAKAYQKQADHVNNEARYNLLNGMAYDKKTIEASSYDKMSPMNKEQLAKRITQTLPHDKNIQKFVQSRQTQNADLCKTLEQHPKEAKDLGFYSSKQAKSAISNDINVYRNQLDKAQKGQLPDTPDFYRGQIKDRKTQLGNLKPNQIYQGRQIFMQNQIHPAPLQRKELLNSNFFTNSFGYNNGKSNYLSDLVTNDKFKQLSKDKQYQITKKEAGAHKEAKRVRPFKKYDFDEKNLKNDRKDIIKSENNMTTLEQRQYNNETIFEDSMDVGNSKDKIFPKRALEYVHYEDNKHAEDKNYGMKDRFKNLTTEQQKALATEDMHNLSQFDSVVNKNGDKAKFLDKHPNVKVRLNLQTKKGQVVRELPEDHNGVVHKGGFSKHFNNQDLSEMASKGYKLANVQSMFGSKASYKKNQNHSLKKYGVDNHSKGHSKSASAKHGKQDSRYNRVLKKLLSAKHNIDKGVKEDREKHKSSKSFSRGDGFDRE